MDTSGTTLILFDVVEAVSEVSVSSEEAARVLGHLLSTGRVQLRDPSARTSSSYAKPFVQTRSEWSIDAGFPRPQPETV